MEVVLDIIEPREGILFISGYVAQAGAVGDKFITLNVLQPAKKQKHAPKHLLSIDVLLSVANIIIDGEPHDTIQADSTAQIGLTGDVEPLLALLKDHHWHERNGRYLLPRNETRLITLSGG